MNTSEAVYQQKKRVGVWGRSPVALKSSNFKESMFVYSRFFKVFVKNEIVSFPDYFHSVIFF